MHIRELTELLGQVKSPVATEEEIERSGLEVVKASSLQVLQRSGRIASNCVDRVRLPIRYELIIYP